LGVDGWGLYKEIKLFKYSNIKNKKRGFVFNKPRFL